MPFPTSTILFLLWFFLACFVLFPYKLLLRVSVNSFQVLVSRHPAAPGSSHSAFSRQTPLHLPTGQHPGSPENGQLFPTVEKSRALGRSTEPYSDRFPTKRSVLRESTLPTRLRRGPGPGAVGSGSQLGSAPGHGGTEPDGLCSEPESCANGFPSAEVKPSTWASLADPRGGL